MTTVSHSEVETFLLCQRKHFYGYTMSLTRIDGSNARDRGTLGHLILARWFEQIKNYQAHSGLVNPSGEEYKAIESHTRKYLGSLMGDFESSQVKEVADLFNFFIEANPFRGFEILAVEKEFTLDLGNGGAYSFVIDLIVRDPRGKMVVVDHKFTYDFYSDTDIALMPQIPKYIGALRALGHDVSYGLYHLLRTRTGKNQTVEDKIKVMPAPASTAIVVQTFAQQIDVTEEIIARKELTPEELTATSRRVGSSLVCKYCDFRSLCAAELRGDDTRLLVKSEYKLRERKVFSP